MDRRPRQIKMFVTRILESHPGELNNIVNEYMNYLSFEPNGFNFTPLTLEDSINGICQELFSSRPATSPYVLSAMVLAKTVDQYLLENNVGHPWYNRDILVDIMTRILVRTEFDPNGYRSSFSWCTIL